MSSGSLLAKVICRKLPSTSRMSWISLKLTSNPSLPAASPGQPDTELRLARTSNAGSPLPLPSRLDHRVANAAPGHIEPPTRNGGFPYRDWIPQSRVGVGIQQLGLGRLAGFRSGDAAFFGLGRPDLPRHCTGWMASAFRKGKRRKMTNSRQVRRKRKLGGIGRPLHARNAGGL